jgi:hypothetical protein
MRKTALLFVFSFIFFSCEKDEFVPDNEIPSWLKSKINEDEIIIKDSPQFLYAWGAWIRYKWHSDYYFEYHNILSSTQPKPISFSGDTLNIIATDANTDYYKEKCCKQYVWKAPNYKEY